MLVTAAVAFSFLEGYDLACFGATVPSILADASIGDGTSSGTCAPATATERVSDRQHMR